MKTLFNSKWEFFNEGEWLEVTLPHTPKIEEYDVGMHFQGKSYYRKSFQILPTDLDKRIVIEFEAIMQYCEIRVNGAEPIKHYGGYLPIYVDMTGVAGVDNIIEIMADNSDMPDVPPGKPLEVLDFCYFGGIYRNTWLHVTDKTFMTLPVQKGKTAGGGVFVTYPSISESEATVNVRVNIENTHKEPDEVSVKVGISYKGKSIATEYSKIIILNGTDRDVIFDFMIDSPKLWSPKNPNLYDVCVEIYRNEDLLEREILPIGIRSVAVKDGEFLLNGTPIKLYGTNRHQSFPYVGNAVSDEAHYRDACLLKEMGVNFIRLCHYPQSESFISACDELGIMLTEPVPGWQWFQDTEQFRRIGIENAREMVLRDRNHPSIIFWEVTLNESHATPNEFCKEVVDAIKSEYPGNQCLCSGDTINKDAEFIGLDISHPSPYKYIKGCEDKPGDAPSWNGIQFYREYGDWNFGGNKSTSRRGREDGEMAMLLSCWNYWHIYSHIFNQPEVIGIANWVGIDYNRGYCPEAPLCRCGALDSLRRKKFLFEMMRSQGTDEAMVFVANYWESEEKTRKIVIFSNCDEVEINVNGKFLERKCPEKGKLGKYKIKGLSSDPYYWIDGTDARDIKTCSNEDNSIAKLDDPLALYNANLMWNGDDAEGTMHPYYIFENIPFERGYIEAVGYIGGEVVASHRVNSYGEPACIEIVPDDKYLQLRANGNDFIFVDANILDNKGNHIYSFSDKVEFCVSGGSIIGPTNPNAIAGKATIMLKATDDVKIEAKCGKLYSYAVIKTDK